MPIPIGPFLYCLPENVLSELPRTFPQSQHESDWKKLSFVALLTDEVAKNADSALHLTEELISIMFLNARFTIWITCTKHPIFRQILFILSIPVDSCTDFHLCSVGVFFYPKQQCHS